MRVLIVKVSALGDILHAMPAVRSLMNSRPDLDVGWVVDSRYSDVMELFGGLSRLHVIDPKGWGRYLREIKLLKTGREARRQLGDIRRTRYDIALDLQGLVKSAAVAKLSGADRVAGFSRDLCREPASACFYKEKVKVDGRLPVAKQIMSLVSQTMDVPDETADPELTVPDRAVETAGGILKGLGAQSPILLVVGAGWPTKVLPAESFSRVAQDLAAAGPVIALAGSENEKKRAQKIISGVGRGSILYRQDILVLAGLFKEARVVIGGDTGLIHLSAQLGTPTVSFYGASLGARSGPEGPAHRWVQSQEDCSPCFARECDNIVCMANLSPEMITAAAHEVMR